MKTYTIQSRVSLETKRQLDELAAQWGETTSDAIRRCIQSVYDQERRMNHLFDYNDFCKLFGRDAEPEQLKTWARQDYQSYYQACYPGEEHLPDIDEVMQFVANY